MNSLPSVLFDPHTDYNIHDPDIFFQICEKLLDNHAPRRKKYIHGNHKPFRNKRLPKAIMRRIRFRNKLLKDPTVENRYIYTIQGNLCPSFLRKEKTTIL